MESADQDDTHSAICLSAARDIVASKLLLTALAHPGKRGWSKVHKLVNLKSGYTVTSRNPAPRHIACTCTACSEQLAHGA